MEIHLLEAQMRIVALQEATKLDYGNASTILDAARKYYNFLNGDVPNEPVHG